MPLETLLPLIASTCFGGICWLFSLVFCAARPSAIGSEEAAWQRLVRPAFAGLVAVAFCAGWAAQEPDPSDERAGVALIALAGFIALVVVRAAVRALLALRVSPERLCIGTIGLLRPRVVVSAGFAAAVSAEALDAACAHERAHVRHHDPLRIWLARLAADLQWPVPTAARRASWMLALEMRCDDEALQSGCSPVVLAEALLAAARLESGYAPAAVARTTGDGTHLGARVRRLLGHPSPPDDPPEVRRVGGLAARLVIVAVAAWAGFAWGDELLRRALRL